MTWFGGQIQKGLRHPKSIAAPPKVDCCATQSRLLRHPKSIAAPPKID
jgi:hypothetical protein